MMLVEQSPYFEAAKKRFTEKIERMNQSASKNQKVAGCQEALFLLNQSVDTASGKEGMLDIAAQLRSVAGSDFQHDRLKK